MPLRSSSCCKKKDMQYPGYQQKQINMLIINRTFFKVAIIYLRFVNREFKLLKTVLLWSRYGAWTVIGTVTTTCQNRNRNHSLSKVGTGTQVRYRRWPAGWTGTWQAPPGWRAGPASCSRTHSPAPASSTRSGSIPLTNGSALGSGSGSSYFRQWPSRWQLKICLLLSEATFT